MLGDLAAAGASAAVSAVVATLLSTAGLAQETRNRTARPSPLERWWRRMAILPFAGARDCPPVPETALPGKSFEDFLGGLVLSTVHFGWKAVTRDDRAATAALRIPIV